MEDLLFKDLISELSLYKKKYYIKELLKGIIFFAGLVFSFYIFINTIEYFGRLGSTNRFLVLIFFIISILIFFWRWLLTPLLQLLNLKSQLSNEDAAKQIGIFFPEIGDKLLNTIQLKESGTKYYSELIQASIAQKTSSFKLFSFPRAVNLKENKKYYPLLFIPLILIFSILIIEKDFFFSSTKRIINYNTNYTISAPFTFKLENTSLKAFKNEDFKIILSVKGSVIPSQVYIVENNKRSKIYKDSTGKFVFVVRNLQKPESFYFEAAGFNSDQYQLILINKPQINNFNVSVNYPDYLKKEKENFLNPDNLTVPEGSVITWNLNTKYTHHIKFWFGPDSTIISTSQNLTSFSKIVKLSTSYYIKLYNKESDRNEELKYSIDVIPDTKPRISINDFKDTISFKSVSLAGIAEDDYGISKILVYYRILNQSVKNPNFKPINIKVNKNARYMNFAYLLNLDTINIQTGESLEYFVKVWDNDGINGSKSSQTGIYSLKIPTQDEIEKNLEELSHKNEKHLDRLYEKTENLKDDFKKLEDKLKNKNVLTWQDRKSIEETLKKQNLLEDAVKSLQQNNKDFNKTQERFNNMDPVLAFKFQQLQKLVDKLLNEETKKLYEELQKLLNEKADKEQVQNLIEKIKNKDNNLANELERSLELLKQLEFEKKLEESIKDLKDLAVKQNDISNETSKVKNNELQELKEKQQNINNEFKKVEEALKELQEQNKELDDKKELESLEQTEKEIEKEQNNVLEQLNNKQQNKASQAQKEASRKIQKMSESLAQMQNNMQMEQSQEDLGDLRAILENTLTLSFEQESLMKDFKKVNQSDPRFIVLSQKQAKLKEDSKVIEDSLLSLAKRVFQIESFVTREVSDMKQNMDESNEALKTRRIDIAAGKQQFTMTSINNLALLLNDVLKQMQEQIANSSPSNGSCKKPGKKGSSLGLGDLQKQLNSSIENLKKSGKTGQALSEELAKLTSQQEMIRKAMEELGKKGAGEKGSGGEMDKLKKQMEETENDLVNKKISQETILRQQEILSRLLEVEKSTKERELDNKRQATNGTDNPPSINPSLEKYLAEKQKEVDLLNTISPDLTPFYKEAVNEYFLKIEK